MKFEDLKIGDTILVRYCGQNVAFSSIHEMKVLKFSNESKAILFAVRYGIGMNEPQHRWHSIDDLNKSTEIFDFVR